MCGIAGIISPVRQNESLARDLLDIKTMTDQLAHRGPDGEGSWQNLSGEITLGHRRLAVIDTSAAATQPMHFENRYTITYNGELYNYIELREQLIAKGHSFRTLSDTEVILAAFHEYREKCLLQFDGMFAMAIWDELEQRLFLARDRFGEKPLFFHEDPDGRFLFASEIKAIWALGVPRIMDEGQVLLFLSTGNTGYPIAPEKSFYKGIFQLPASSFMYILPGKEGYSKPESIRYWDIDTRQKFGGSLPEAIRLLQEKLNTSVQLRLRADVQTGTSLSGGVDSGSIAALASRLEIAGFQGFSATFPGFEKDESALINSLSKEIGFTSRQTSPAAENLVSDFDRLLWHQEEPIGSASVLVQYKVFELAKQHGVTVLLDGQGADEILGGYPQYIPWFLQEEWRSGNWARQRRELALFRRHGLHVPWGLKNYLAALFPAAAQSQLISRQSAKIRNLPLVNKAYIEAYHPAGSLYKPMVTGLRDLLYYDTTMGKLPELLRYADRNSMAHSREVRLPFLQHELVQWIFSLPDEWRMKDGYTKWILRKSMENVLPPATCWQKLKIAFEPPQLQWMKTPAVQERVMDAKYKLVQNNILDKKILKSEKLNTPAESRNNFDWRYWVIASLE
ncbi:asparagine synthase (glutamine-hydrolyzing) [Flavihumibacter profundi]|uniref:asparagine synthase (glutamine-hydrolyzing) n=1 Tax=Flavihumibacter profundi TaxID=2716883 RepID=UPI001CC751ED|nr:asparagine synthase (glutamine-hydrolyzing) [Flavihumibacter profundi]MBZ5857484.1 asparagine synthase (glutamine-hydrolyzing) [Flavihumibacter profundi]